MFPFPVSRSVPLRALMHWRLAYAPVASSFAAVAGLLAVLFLLSLLLTFVSLDVYRSRAQEALNSHTLIERSPLLLGADPYRYGQNDCLILSMLATKPPGTRLQAAISPASPSVAAPEEFRSVGFDSTRTESRATAEARGTPRMEHCYLLKQSLEGSPPVGFYHRYIHGYWVLAAALLALLPFSTATAFLHVIALGLPFALLIVTAKRQNWPFAMMAAAYLLFSGVWLASWHIDLAPAEIILSGFLLYASQRPVSYASAAILGTLAASFDFLTGLIPSALTLLIGLIAIKRGSIQEAAAAVTAFCAAVLFAFGLKALAVALLWSPDEVVAAISVLAGHASSSPVSPAAATILEKYGLSPEAVSDNRLLSFAFALGKYAYFSDLVAFGSRPLGIFAVVVGPALLIGASAWGAFRSSKAFLLLCAGFVPICWTFVFVEHAAQNALWMQRMMPWLTILLAGGAASVGIWRRTPLT